MENPVNLQSPNTNIEPLQENVLSSVKFKKIFFALAYLFSVPIFVGFVALFSLYFKYYANGYVSRQTHKLNYQAIPVANSSSAVSIENKDGRVKNLDDFFRSYSSPLEGHAAAIVSEADKYKIDYRLLPAIAMQESTLCKNEIKNSFNCWGFGIYKGKVTRFDSYDEGIAVITKTMAQKYVQQGYVTIEDIVRKYTPSDTGKWEFVVNLIMDRLKASF
jgi:hypothetical protein